MNCNICGKDQFSAGPHGRMATSNLPPYCRNCGSLERQRIIRRVFQAFPLGFLDRRRALLLGHDNALEKRWFQSFASLTREDSLELAAQGFVGTGMARPANSYELVALHHILEFIPDDRAALRSLVAMLSPRGMLEICFSSPHSREQTQDFEQPQAGSGAYHLYGRNVLTYFSDVLAGMSAVTVEETDLCTGVREVVHLLFKFAGDAENAARWLKLSASARVDICKITPPPSKIPSQSESAKAEALAKLATADLPAVQVAPVASIDEELFAPLKAELALWQAADRVCDFWWRDDDLVKHGPLLQQLADLAQEFSAPVLVAVIPAQADPDLPRDTAAMDALVFCQHGYNHVSHEGRDAPSSEFGAARPLAEIAADLRLGHARLKELFGTRFFPVFVPPWNRFISAALPFLQELQFIGLSQYADQARHQHPGLRVVNTHVDIVQWSSTPNVRCQPVPLLVSRLVDLLQQQRQRWSDNSIMDEPIGLLSHHRVMRDDCWAFMRQLLQVTRAFSCVRWRSPQEVFISAQPDA